MDIILREMRLEDLDDVLQIEEKTFSPPWSRKSFEMEINENLLSTNIVAQYQEKILGYAGMWTVIDEGHITNIAVDEEYKGKSIGNYLLMGLIKQAINNGIYKITLEVRKSNQVAINLYKKHGFIEAGIRKDYYVNEKEDAIIMWKTIERQEVE